MVQDNFGINEIYPTKSFGEEWYVNMADPRSDPRFRDLPNQMVQQPDGSWQVGLGEDIRLEAWSALNKKWWNVEVTSYQKFVSKSGTPTYALQQFTRGGHHPGFNSCDGSAYKGRLYFDGRVGVVKEINHPAYTQNKGVAAGIANGVVLDKWYGMKTVVYNYIDAALGKVCVAVEIHLDTASDDNGTLNLANQNWQRKTLYKDVGGWSTTSNDFMSTCPPLDMFSQNQYRRADEILSLPGGPVSENLAGWRTDDVTWNFKFLTVREIQQPATPPA